MDIKITKIANMIILVLGDDILQRTLDSEDEADIFFEDSMATVYKLRSGLVTDADEYAKSLLSLRVKMNARKALEKKEQQEREQRISQETFDLAKGDDEDDERLETAVNIIKFDDDFEYDSEGYVYLKGHSVPMPSDLVKQIKKANEGRGKFTIESLKNFWKWAVLNPNPEARNDLFGWFKTGEFSITEDGMIVAYRCVDYKDKDKKESASSISSALKSAVIDQYTKAKASKKNPANYGIFQKEDGTFIRFVISSNEGYLTEKGYEGNLKELYEALVDDESSSVDNNDDVNVFTDRHTGTMTIELNKEVTMPRKDCDERRHESCSRGLHFMSKKYSLRLGDVKLIVLVNPMNIVAFPAYDNTKGRCCAYMPVAHADIDDKGDIETLGSGSFDFNYGDFSKEKLGGIIMGGGYQDLIDDGEMSSEVLPSDFSFLRVEARNKIKSRVVNA